MKILRYQISRKSLDIKVILFRQTDKTDMTELIFAFRNFFERTYKYVVYSRQHKSRLYRKHQY